MKIILVLLMMTGFSLSAHADDKPAPTPIEPTGLKDETGLGMVLTSGNTSTTTISATEKAAYTADDNVYKFSGNYLKTSNNGVEQAYQWGLGLRYERELSKMFNLFAGEKLESDKYQNIEQRYSTDLGSKYFFQQMEGLKWFMEAGYRFSRENYPYGFKNFNFVRLYHEIEKSYGPGLSGKWWVEYLPNLTAWKAYQFNTEFSISVILTEVFSLKTAYQIRYYNEPPAGVAKTTDTTYTMALVAKF